MRVASGVLALLLGACLESNVVVCEDGTLCPGEKVCSPGNECVDQAQVDACEGVADGADCDLGFGQEQCRGGACVRAGCGDGVEDPGEACDDGNDVDDDACTNGCALPSCGDAIVQTGEECDLGPDNADDELCTTRCLDALCGDGFVRDNSDEECDDGAANSDADVCTLSCLRNVCGDGHLWVGFEICDDGGTFGGDGCSADCDKVEVCGDTVVDAGEDCDDANANPADGCDACVATAWIASVVLGEVVTDVLLSYPSSAAVDPAGNVFIADTVNHRVRRVDAVSGAITTVAGTGEAGFSGDGGPATNARLNSPRGVDVDGLGNIYIGDTANHRVRKVDGETGVVTTVAGTGGPGLTGDNGDATFAQLDTPQGIAVDGFGTIYIADSGNHRIRRIDAVSRIITTWAGSTQGSSGDDGAAFLAQLDTPGDVALDVDGNLYIADTQNNRVRKVDATGWITLVADAIVQPSGVDVDASGAVFVAETNGATIRRVDGETGAVTVVAGDGVPGYSGDGGPATSAMIGNPVDVVVLPGGAFLIVDIQHHRIRRVVAGTIDLLVGGISGSPGDGGAAVCASITTVAGVTADPSGHLYFVDSQRIRRVDAVTGVVTTIVGSVVGFAGDGGPGVAGMLADPKGIATDTAGNLFIADRGNGRIRKLTASTGLITTVAGSTGTPAFAGDDGPATEARLGSPADVAIDAIGNLYIADAGNFRIRKVDVSTGFIDTIVGTGTAGDTGDGLAPTSAQIGNVRGIALGPGGALYLADTQHHRVRRVAGNTIETVAGTGTAGFDGDGADATDARLRAPDDVIVDASGNLYIADTGNRRIRRVDAVTQQITTIAGTGSPFNDGDGGPASLAELTASQLALDPDGRLLLSDLSRHRIRRIEGGTITTVAGPVSPDGMGPLATARLADPRAFVIAPSLTLFAGRAVLALRDDTLEAVAGWYAQTDPVADLARYRDEQFGGIGGLALDAADGIVYITEPSANRLHAVTIVDPDDATTWTIAELAGNGVGEFADGPVASSSFRGPTGTYLDAVAQVLYVADPGNSVIRTIDLDAGTVSTFAGTPEIRGFFGDDGVVTASEALLYNPQALTRCPSGDFYVADTGNHRVRRIAVGTNAITTVLGDGVATSSGQGAPARQLSVDTPLGLACDALGNLFVTSTTTVKLLPADDLGIVDGTGPVQTIFASTPSLPTPCLTGVEVVDAETVWATDACTGTLLELWRQPV